MNRKRRYQVVAIALHASPKHIDAFVAWLRLNSHDLARREIHWKPVHREDETSRLPFGRGAKKNVHAHLLVPQLLECGFHFTGAQIELRRDVYSLSDQRRLGRAQAPAGQAKTDKNDRPLWKQSLLLTFEKTTEPADSDIPSRFSAMLGAVAWKRCRIVEQFPEQKHLGIAVVELSGPKLKRPDKNRVISLTHAGGFTCLDVGGPRPLKRP